MQNMMQQQKARKTWIGQVKGARASFRYHLISYCMLTVFFWMSWTMYGRSIDQSNWLPWPFYPMLFGAVGLFFHFLAAYLLPEKNEHNEE